MVTVPGSFSFYRDLSNRSAIGSLKDIHSHLNVLALRFEIQEAILILVEPALGTRLLDSII